MTGQPPAELELDHPPDDIDDRPLLVLDPTSSIAIKRDVRRIDVGTTCAAFAEAFHAVLREPGARFGLIEILRKAERTGKPFVLGERFQGRFSLERGLIEELRDSVLHDLSGFLARAVDVLEIDELLELIADKVASDYGVITRLDLDPPPGEPYCIRYDYLEGTPIAGSSTFTIEPIDGGCRFRQVFLYQEQRRSVVGFMGTSGLKLHNDVVWEEVTRAAQRLNAPILADDMHRDG